MRSVILPLPMLGLFLMLLEEALLSAMSVVLIHVLRNGLLTLDFFILCQLLVDNAKVKGHYIL